MLTVLSFLWISNRVLPPSNHSTMRVISWGSRIPFLFPLPNEREVWTSPLPMQMPKASVKPSDAPSRLSSGSPSSVPDLTLLARILILIWILTSSWGSWPSPFASDPLSSSSIPNSHLRPSPSASDPPSLIPSSHLRPSTVARPSIQPFSSGPPTLTSSSSVPNSDWRPPPFARPSNEPSLMLMSSHPAPSPLSTLASILMPLPMPVSMPVFFDLPSVCDSATSGNLNLSLSGISGMPRISLPHLFLLPYARRPKIRAKRANLSMRDRLRDC